MGASINTADASGGQFVSTQSHMNGWRHLRAQTQLRTRQDYHFRCATMFFSAHHHVISGGIGPEGSAGFDGMLSSRGERMRGGDPG